VVSVASLFGADADVLGDRSFRLLLLANVNIAAGTVLVSPMLASLTGPFGVTDAEAGLLLSAFTAPGILGIPVVGVVADRVGRRPLLVGGLTLFGLAGTAVALVTDFRAALVLRALQGVGFACVLPVVIATIGDLYEGAAEAAAQGFRFTSSGLTQALIPAGVGVVASVSWRYPFLLYVVALPAAALIHARFDTDRAADPEPVPNGGGTDEPTPSPGTEAVTDQVPDDRSDDGERADEGSYLRELLWLATRPRVVAVLVALGLGMFLYTGLLTYNSFLVVRVLSGTPGQAGLLVTALSVSYAASASQAGRISAAVNRPVALLAGNGVMALGLVGVGLAPSFPVAVTGSAVMGAGTGVLFSLLRSSVTRLAPETLRGGLVGIAEATIRLTASIAPLGTGLIVVALEPATGSVGAIRWALVAVGVAGAVVGSVALLAGTLSPPVRTGAAADGD
jgi:MFS family permease